MNVFRLCLSLTLCLAFATPGSADTSLLKHFLKRCGEAYFTGEQLSFPDLPPYVAGDAEGRRFFELTNGYILIATSYPGFGVGNCEVSLVFPDKLNRSLQDEIDEFLQWASEKKAEGVLYDKSFKKDDRQSWTTYYFRNTELPTQCLVLYFVQGIDQSPPKLDLVFWRIEGARCGEFNDS